MRDSKWIQRDKKHRDKKNWKLPGNKKNFRSEKNISGICLHPRPKITDNPTEKIING